MCTIQSFLITKSIKKYIKLLNLKVLFKWNKCQKNEILDSYKTNAFDLLEFELNVYTILKYRNKLI